MKKSVKKVKLQSSFCLDLMKRLDSQIQDAKVSYGRIEGHTRLELDAIRIRRELNDLNAMLREWGYEE